MFLHLSKLPKLILERRGSAIFAVIILFMIWGGFEFSYLQDVQRDEKEAVANSRNLAAVFEENVLRSLGEIDKALLYLRRTIESRKESTDIGAIIGTADVLSEIIVQVAIIDSQGILRGSNVGPQPTPPMNLSDREHFIYHLHGAGDALFISKPMVGKSSKQWSVQATRRFLNPNGSFAGVVVASLNPSHFANFYDKIDVGSAGAIALIGDDGVVRSSGGTTHSFQLGQDLHGTPLFQRMQAGANATFTDSSSGRMQLLTLRKVRGQPLWVNVSLDAADIYSLSSSALKRDLIIGVLLTFMVLLALELILRREEKARLERQKLGRENRLLSQLNEWLQSCKSLEELYKMVGDVLNRLLPDCAGALYIYANSRDVLENVYAWNGSGSLPTIHPDDCWGLRRGRTYTVGEQEIEFKCAHVEPRHSGRYCCIPILAHGETIGMLHLDFSEQPSAGKFEGDVVQQRRLGLLCAEQISLAIANVKLRDQLRDQSIRDPLTGMFNRRYMLETCRREFARAKRAGQTVAVLSIDVDHFKQFNDNHGHDAGDVVLRSVGACLQSSFRDEDVPCRYGGEEFVVVLPGTTMDDAVNRAEAVRAEIEALSVRYFDQALPRITISVGVALFPASGSTIEAVLKIADDALYRAKENGRNRVERASTTASPDLVPCQEFGDQSRNGSFQAVSTHDLRAA
jgi:diguanylate cyclase (GGDEF)-like protein